MGSYAKEKDIVLAIALKAGKYIEEKLPGVKVIYTRTTDVFVPLDERAKIANDAKADLFISIHANSNPNKRPYGTETFAMGLHKTDGNLEVAKKENSVIVYEDNYEAKYEGFDPNDIESYIMMTLMQDTYLDQSLTVASLVQDQFRQRAMRYDRGVKQAGFLVLWKTSMPSILIETGFVSNKSEEKFLSSEQGQDYLASAIFRAFRDYKALMEGNAPELAHKVEEKKVEETTKVEEKEVGTDTDEKLVETPRQEAPVQKPRPQTTETDAEPISGQTPKREISFKVQILYSENKVDLNSDLFKDFNDVEEISYNGKYKYVVGSKPTYAEAIEYSKWVKNRHPDAFIVAVSNGKIIPLSEATLPKKTN